MGDQDRLSRLQEARRATLEMSGANLTYDVIARELSRRGYAGDIIDEVLSRCVADDVAALRKSARAGYYYAASLFGAAAVLGVATVATGGAIWAVAGFGAAGGALGVRGLADKWRADQREKMLLSLKAAQSGGDNA